MFTKIPVTDRTVYMEVYGQNKVSYRVIAGRMGNVITYGIETVDSISGETETIPDFSRNVNDAVAFAENLIRNRITPKHVYIKALEYLKQTI